MNRRRILGNPVARFVCCAAIVLVAIIVTPYAFAPGFNSADAIIVAAPFALLAVGWRRDETKAVRRRAMDERLARIDEAIEADGTVPRRRDRH